MLREKERDSNREISNDRELFVFSKFLLSYSFLVWFSRLRLLTRHHSSNSCLREPHHKDTHESWSVSRIFANMTGLHFILHNQRVLYKIYYAMLDIFLANVKLSDVSVQ